MSSPSSPYASRITGTGSAFPARRVTNDEIAKNLAKIGEETSDEWIRERTGIVERRISEAGSPQETNSALCVRAAQQALAMAGKKPEDIDLIIVGTCSPDTLIPSTACWIQAKLGAKNAWGFDLNAACSGFVYSLASADQFVRSGHARTVLVLGADVLHPYVDWTDRSTCILFGDAAGAVIIEQTSPTNPTRILSSHLLSDGTLAGLFHMPAGGSAMPLTPDIIKAGQHRMKMKGKEVFKEATLTLAKFAEKALAANGLKISDLNWMIPHQANLRIIESE